MDFQKTALYCYQRNRWQSPAMLARGQSKQVRQGEPMMDGPWQEVIYNLSVACESAGQLRQTERDKERQKQKGAHRIDGQVKKKMKLCFISLRSFISSQVGFITARVKAAGDKLHSETRHEAHVCCGIFSMSMNLVTQFI